MAAFNFCARGIEVEYKKENVRIDGTILRNGYVKLHHIFIIKDVTFKGTPYGLWSTLGDISHPFIKNKNKSKNKIRKIWSAIKQKYAARPNKKIDYIEAKVDAQDWNKEEAYELVMQTLNALERAGYHNNPSDAFDNPSERTEINFHIVKNRGAQINSLFKEQLDDSESTCVSGEIDRFIGPKKPLYEEIHKVAFVYYPLNDYMEQSFPGYIYIDENPTHYPGPCVYPAVYPASPLQPIKALFLGKDLTIDPKPKNEVTQ